MPPPTKVCPTVVHESGVVDQTNPGIRRLLDHLRERERERDRERERERVGEKMEAYHTHTHTCPHHMFFWVGKGEKGAS